MKAMTEKKAQDILLGKPKREQLEFLLGALAEAVLRSYDRGTFEGWGFNENRLGDNCVRKTITITYRA